MARRPPLSPDDAAAKKFEAGKLFTPSAPIAVAELFAGRQPQVARIVDAISEIGRHVILYGERGVGKSSLAQIIPFFIPKPQRQKVEYVRVQAFPNDDFNSLALKIFRRIQVTQDLGEGEQTYNIGQFYANGVTADDFVREMESIPQAKIPLIVIDEFNEITDPLASVMLANIIKALSDSGSHVTLLVIGVASSVTDLIGSHESIQRCTEQVLMPRMPQAERREVLERRLTQLGMAVEGDGKWKIINLSKGLPAYVHALGKNAVYSALDERRSYVLEQDVDRAIETVLQSSQQSYKDLYEKATKSNQPGSLFRHVITACALARVDDSGYFTPTWVREPLSAILKRPIDIANFHNHLKEFALEKRGQILERVGESKNYRFRFGEPAMQPYTIMKGIRDGIVDETAKQALSSSEQPDLFPT